MCKSRISKPISLPLLARCCTILHSRWYQSGIRNRGLRVAGPFALDGRVRMEEDLGTHSHASYRRISSSCLRCAFGEIIANARSRSQHSTGFSTWPTIPTRRDLRTTIAVLSERSLS